MRKLAPRGLLIVRLVVAGLLAVHGWSRALTGGVVPFGHFLTAKGLPFGTAIAAAITAFEIIGTALLFAGRGVRWIALGHIAILSGGIAIVHAREGWFVVGGGRNGVEYSVLLIGCLVALAIDDGRR